MQPVLFELGPVTVYSYGVFAAIAFAVGAYIVYLLAARDKLSRAHLLDYYLYVALAALIGARVWYVAFRPDEVTSFLNFFTVGGGGLAWPGGVLLASVVLVWALRRNHDPVWKWLDIVAIGTLAGLAVGKFGSFLNGDGFGTASGLPWAIEFKDQFAPGSIVGAPLHPVQLYASILFALTACGLWRLHYDEKSRNPGSIFWMGLGALALISLVLEPFHSALDALTFPHGPRVIIPTALILVAASTFVWIQTRRRPS